MYGQAAGSGSGSSVVRACRRPGFRGYRELKIAAARQAPAQAPSRDRDPAARALADTVRAAREALDEVAATVTPERLRTAAGLIDAAPRVLAVGAGLSGAVALDTAYRLRALGCAVDAPADPLTAPLAASQLTSAGVCLAISHTGATRSTVDAARGARRAGAKVIALTSHARSPLSESDDCTLVAGGQDLVFGLETVASRLAHLAVVDDLTLTLPGLRGAPAEAALQMSADVTVDHSH